MEPGMLKIQQDYLKLLVGRKRNVIFLCIGTDRATGDALAPLVGTELQKAGYIVYGTLEYPVHAVNLQDTVARIKRSYPKHFVIAIDACLGQLSSVGNINVYNKPLKPGAGVGKSLGEAGDISIVGIVNVGGFMEAHVVANTRLYLIMGMAEQIADMCKKTVMLPKVKQLLVRAV